MAALDNDSAALLAAIRRDAFIANSDDNWTDARILSIADDMTLSIIAPALKRTRQGWFREDIDLPISAGVSDYALPEEAMWESIEAGYLVDPSTRQVLSQFSVVSPASRLGYSNASPGVPQVAWFSGSRLTLAPAPSAQTVGAYSVTLSMYRRPAQLCTVANTARVTAVASVTQTLTITTLPTAWTTDTYTSGTPYRVDIYNRTLPNTRHLWNKTVTSPGSTSLVFSPSVTAAEFALIQVGDVVTEKGTSPYPDMPPEAVPVLRRMVQKTIVSAQVDSEALQAYLAQQSAEMELMFRGMSNRADGSPRKLSLRDAAGARFMRNYGARYRGF